MPTTFMNRRATSNAIKHRNEILETDEQRSPLAGTSFGFTHTTPKSSGNYRFSNTPLLTRHEVMSSFKKQYLNPDKQYSVRSNKPINFIERNKLQCFITEMSPFTPKEKPELEGPDQNMESLLNNIANEPINEVDQANDIIEEISKERSNDSFYSKDAGRCSGRMIEYNGGMLNTLNLTNAESELARVKGQEIALKNDLMQQRKQIDRTI